MRHIQYWAKGISLFCLLWTSVSPAEEQDLSSTSHCPTLPYEEGRLFEITKQGKPASFIFGTMHVTDPEIAVIPEIVEKSISRIEYVATEVLTKPRPFGFHENVKRIPMEGDLFSIIGSEREKKIKEIAKGDELFIKVVQKMRPWEVSFILAVLNSEPETEEALPLFGAYRLNLDEAIGLQGRLQKKKYIGLESPADQIALFDQMPLELQLEMVDEALKPIDYDSENYSKVIKEAYLSGRTGLLHCEAANSKHASKAMNTYMLENVLNKRNLKMHEKIKKLFDHGAFVAVGAAHLPGEEGILSLLNKDGYEIKRLKISNQQN